MMKPDHKYAKLMTQASLVYEMLGKMPIDMRITQKTVGELMNALSETTEKLDRVREAVR